MVFKGFRGWIRWSTSQGSLEHRRSLDFSILTTQQIEAYGRDGFVGPFRALSSEDARAAASRVAGQVIGEHAGQIGAQVHCRHLDSRLAYDLCTLPAVVERVAAVNGPDLVLWRSNFWCKRPGDAAVAWHQDFTHWPLAPVVNVTAWLALDSATRANGCLQVIPGSHHAVHPTKPLTGDPLSDSVEDRCVDLSEVVHLELDAGEFVLFSEKLLHASSANSSSARRLALASRITVPSVRIDHDRLPGDHRSIVICGEDQFGLNRYGLPPERRSAVA